MQTGTELIAAERQRQVAQEGWTLEHDDEHDDGELLQAARCYLSLNPDYPHLTGAALDWPWHPDWWKPSPDPIRNLVKAGALIAAEIDRLQRKAAG